MDRTYDALLDENNELRKALATTREMLERKNSDYEGLRRVHEEFKLHHERVKKDAQEANLKCADAVKARKETENYYETYVQKLKSSLEQGKREFEEIQSKMIPPIDTELLRLRLVNEIEGPMKIALDNKEDEISRLQSQIYDLTRKLDLSQLQYNSYKAETEKEIRDIKERYSKETTHLFGEIQHLQEKIEDSTDKETIRALKRDREDQRIKNEKLYEELEDVKKRLETQKNEKNEAKVRLGREAEEERNKVRLSNIERDRLELQNKDLIDQVHKYKLSLEVKQQEISTLKKDLESYISSLESAETQITHNKEEMAELQRKTFEKEAQSENKLRETLKTEKEKYNKDKDEKEKLQRQSDLYEQKIREMTSNSQNQEREFKHEIERKKQEISNLKEDLRLQESKNMAMTKEIDLYKENFSSKNEEIERYQNDLKALSLRYNDAMRNNENFVSKIQQMEIKIEKADNLRGFNEDVRGLEEKLKNSESQASFFKAKAREYKLKVKQGNEKIQELGLKLAKSEIERQKMLGARPVAFEKDPRLELKGHF